MESSFFEYRDKTVADSDSGSEVIDNSLEVDDPFSTKKKPFVKNQTVFVAESEESSEEDESEEEAKGIPKIKLTRSSVAKSQVVSSSDDDTNQRGSIRRQSQLEMSFNNVVLSSSESDEEQQEASPEILPKRRPPQRPSPKTSLGSPDTSIIGRKKKNKRMILADSDTENSIIIEYNKNKKQQCLKDTPLKVDDNKMALRKKCLNESVMNQSVSYTDEGSGDDDNVSNDIENHKSIAKTPSRIKNREALKKADDSIETDDETSQNDSEKRQSDDVKDITDDEDETDNEGLDKDHPTDTKDPKNDSDVEQVDNEGETTDEDDKTDSEGLDKDHQIDTKDPKNDSDVEQVDVEGQTTVVVDKTDSGGLDKDHQIDTNDQENDSDVEQVDDEGETDDDGPDEDQMVYSRATRMSIMGVVPRGVDESEESDFIESEKSRSSSASSLSELPDVTIARQTQKKPTHYSDSSRISCSPIASPLHDVTNEANQSDHLDETEKVKNKSRTKTLTLKHAKDNKENEIDDDVTFVDEVIDSKRGKRTVDDDVTFVSTSKVTPKRERVIDDDITIVESKPVVIALSSDDEDDTEDDIKKSPKFEESSRGRKDGTMKQYLVPPSYPNQQIVYVKKHVRENELSKLEGLKEDLHNIKMLLENMDLDTLPDGGAKLMQRYAGLEKLVREQGEKVSNMVIEPDMPTAADLAKDGFDPQSGLSWEQLQKGSQAVQPRMFGKQAMATHMAERNLILERLRDLHESLASRPPESSLATPPRLIKSTMMPHQLHALAWLRWRETQRPTGGILADDMGLGKTITMISLVVGDKEGKMDDEDDEERERGFSKLALGGTLVVCPASLVQQWSGEVSKHCAPHAAAVCLHHGAARTAHAHRLATYDIVLTTYNILQRDCEKNGVLMKILWRRIILDEAHIVRNHKSATSMAVSALKGKRRWCLTGTPVQNKDLDLFALLKFLRCTPFDELTMWKKWIDNKSQGGQDRLSTIMQCILLRRTKVQLQEKGELKCLPKRTVHLQDVTLSKEEMNVYQKVLVFSKTLFGQFLHQRAEKQADLAGLDAPANNANSAYDDMHKRMIKLQGAKPVKSHEILVLLLRLRQVCCHCGLIASMLDEDTAGDHVDMDPGGQDLLAELNKLSLEDSQSKRKSKQTVEDKDDDEEEGPGQEGTTAAEAIRSVLSPNNPVFQLDNQSSKIRAVMDCLNENVFSTKDDKAVVVSQWTSLLRLVEKELSKSRVRCVTLSGSVPVPQRPPLIDKLNDPHSPVRVMLLSLTAGGVGLNLCGANHLLLLDPHWNPQLEEQAQDRVFRVGQAKPVHIYRFMCVDTVEQTIRKLQIAKLELAENVLTGAKNTNNSKLTIEDLKMLFNMGQQ